MFLTADVLFSEILLNPVDLELSEISLKFNGISDVCELSFTSIFGYVDDENRKVLHLNVYDLDDNETCLKDGSKEGLIEKLQNLNPIQVEDITSFNISCESVVSNKPLELLHMNIKNVFSEFEVPDKILKNFNFKKGD